MEQLVVFIWDNTRECPGTIGFRLERRWAWGQILRRPETREKNITHRCTQKAFIKMVVNVESEGTLQVLMTSVRKVSVHTNFAGKNKGHRRARTECSSTRIGAISGKQKSIFSKITIGK